MPDVASHLEELVSVLKTVKHEAAGRPKKRHPSRFSHSIWHDLTAGKVNPWCLDPQGINHSIRQVHDFYGWMAKHGPNGTCAGTLYRTHEFMRIERAKRNGTKQEDRRNVHIEHTVPVASLILALRNERKKFTNPIALHRFLMGHSVCVAFSYDEERALGSAGVAASTNDVFDSAGKRVHDHPMKRYAPLRAHGRWKKDFHIVNVVTGETIDLETFTFADHLETLAQASRRALGEVGPSLYSLELFDPSHWKV